MSKVELEQLLGDAEALLAVSGELQYPPTKAVGMLLNAVEALYSDKQELVKEVERLRQQLEAKKRHADRPQPPLLRDRRS